MPSRATQIQPSEPMSTTALPGLLENCGYCFWAAVRFMKWILTPLAYVYSTSQVATVSRMSSYNVPAAPAEARAAARQERAHSDSPPAHRLRAWIAASVPHTTGTVVCRPIRRPPFFDPTLNTGFNTSNAQGGSI